MCQTSNAVKSRPAFPPLQISCGQQLKSENYALRRNFAGQMKAIFEANDHPISLKRDGAHFHLNGIVNQQNCRYQALENPRKLHAKPLRYQKAKVWWAVGKAAVIGPYFFENNNGNAVTVNFERYTEMINNFLVPELGRKRVLIRRLSFQQDGATAYTPRASMDELCSLFGDRLISRFGDIPWPPRSLDLFICDNFLGGYLNACVYEHKPRTLQDLKEAICVEVAPIDKAMLEKVEVNFQELFQKCINENWPHMKDIVFQT